MPPSLLGPCGHHCDNACGPGLCDFRPPASQESAPRPLRAPRAVKAQGGTLVYVVTYWDPNSTMESESSHFRTWREACRYAYGWVRRGWCASVVIA